MKKYMKRVLLMATCAILGSLNVMRAGHNQPGAPCVKMHFAGKTGSKYALLIMGAEAGEYTLDWGDGKTHKGKLNKTATRIQGNIEAQDLIIYGNIAVLECSNNQLTTLDVTKLSALTHLISRKNFVRDLDVSGNPELKLLYVQDSPLEQLDLTHNSKIDSLILTNNRLKELTLASHPTLELLMCTSNAQLKHLNLKDCPKLKHLDALQTLVDEYDLSKNSELRYVAVGLGRPLRTLSLPPNNKIDTLMVPAAGLKTIDLSQTKQLKLLGIDNNYELSQLDLTGMTQLKALSCEGNALTSLNLSACRNLESLVCNNNQLTTLDVSGLNKLETLTCFSNDLATLNLTGCTSMKNLDCSVNPKLSTADFPRSLTSLNCSSCNFTQIETTKLPLLTNLTCGGNQIGTLNLTAQTKLTAINCGNNKIEQLDFSNCTSLLDVVIAGNPISGGIGFNNCNNLRYVSVNNTKLDACALNAMYRSLREKRPEDDESDLHGILLYNNVPGAAKVSNTQIATDKGWMVSVVGDGTGCQEEGDRIKKVVVSVDKAGELEDKIPENVWLDVVDTLKIVGPLNSYDLRWVRKFCGSDEYGALIPTTLKRIDLSEVTFVSTGDTSDSYYIFTDDMGKDRKYFVDGAKPTLLPEKLFFKCCSIESVVLPKHIREIGIGAFFKCVSMKEVVIPDEVTEIQNTAFGVCDALETIQLPSKLKTMGNYVFTYCAKLKEVAIPDGVTKINKRTFDQTPKLKKLTLPKSLRELAIEAFFGANGLEQIQIPDGITTLPEGAFGMCEALKKAELPASLTKIDKNAFQDCHNLETIELKEGLKHIAVYAFQNCKKLHNVTLPNSLETIENEAFLNCNDMAGLKLGSGLKTIGEKAFFHNHGIESLEIPKTTEKIDYAAFAECLGLKRVALGMSAAELVDNPFLGCAALQSFEVDANNEKYAAENGTLYAKDYTTLYIYPNGKNDKNFTMNASTKKVADFAFWYCKNLEKVEFSPAFNEFGYRAFCGCSGLNSLTVKTSAPVENPYMDDVFEGVKRETCTLTVPAGSKQAYSVSRTWKDFNIVEATPDAIESVYNEKPTVQNHENSIVVSGVEPQFNTVALYNFTGCKLAEVAVQSGNARIDATGVPSGVYVITLRGAKRSCSLKLIRQ
jgi:internalin-related protein